MNSNTSIGHKGIRNKEGSLKENKKYAVLAAVELGYDSEVISKIEHAKSATEVTRAMIDARHDNFY